MHTVRKVLFGRLQSGKRSTNFVEIGPTSERRNIQRWIQFSILRLGRTNYRVNVLQGIAIDDISAIQLYEHRGIRRIDIQLLAYFPRMLKQVANRLLQGYNQSIYDEFDGKTTWRQGHITSH
ncbi:hypothetical protein WL09_11775 [Burkholderia ubonensis]|nr:hypothetical protein WL09_11775 [Burkholderia ubonensis]